MNVTFVKLVDQVDIQGECQGTSGLVLKANTSQGKAVLKRSTCEVPW
jgi:hypothetical protein